MRTRLAGWVLVVALGATAGAARADTPTQITERTETAMHAAERRVAELGVRRAELAARYEDELRAIDRLKKQRASWRRDRDIQTSMAASLETAKQLAEVTGALATAEQTLAATRRALLAAVDAEQPSATGTRAQRLGQLHDQLAPTSKARARKIRIPNADIDPLADPEELDEQAQALRDSEAELARQVQLLEQQAGELDRVAQLRKQHERAGELGTRDDDAARHGAQRPSGSRETVLSGNGAADHAPTPTAGGAAGGGVGSSPGTGTGADAGPTAPVTSARDPYETDATVVLSDVVDAHTIDSLQKAQRSGDPAVRAAAARQARDAVSARLARLKAQRAAIESRAKQLRTR